MTRRLLTLLVLAASLSLPTTARAVDDPHWGNLRADLGITGCFVNASGSGAAWYASGCIVASRSINGGGVDVTVRLRGQAPVTANLPASAMRRGASPQNYWSTLLDGEVPGIGALHIYTEDDGFRGPSWSNAGCFGDPPLTVVLNSPGLSIADAGVFGTIAGQRIVRYGSGCSATFVGETAGSWVMT